MLQPLLETYQVFIDEHIQKITKDVVVIGVIGDEITDIVLDANFFQNEQEIQCDMCLYLRVKANLKQLKKLENLLKDFLKPIDPFKKLWIGLHDCDIYRKYIEKSFDKIHVQGSPIERLALCLKKTNELLLQLLSSQQITYDQITIGESLKLEEVEGDLEEEFDRINELMKCESSKGASSISGIKAMMSLFQAKPNVELALKACEVLEMTGCLADAAFAKLRSVCSKISTEEGKANLTAEKAIEYMNEIKSKLRYEELLKLDIFLLLEKITSSTAFYDFVKDQFFCRDRSISDAVQSFHTWYQVISTQLQDEDFGENVLRELSHAFTCIIPFMEKEQTLDQLLNELLKLNPSNKFLELQTVSANMHHILRWSVQAEVCYIHFKLCLYSGALIVQASLIFHGCHTVNQSSVALLL